MSRKWYPAAPRVGGTSPKDRNVVVGGGSRELDSGQARLRAAENLYHKRCEEVIKQHLVGYDGAGDVVEFMTEAAYLAMTEAELPTSLAGDDQTKTKERIARAALVAATAAILVGTVIVASQIDQAVIQATSLVAQATAGALVGARVGGAKGGAVGAFAGLAAGFPAVDAKPYQVPESVRRDAKQIAERKPQTNVVKTDSQQLKTRKSTKPDLVIGRYPISELLLPKENVYIVLKKGGDWAFLPGNRLIPLYEFFGNKPFQFNDVSYVLIKNSDIRNFLSRNDVDGFRELMERAREEVENKVLLNHEIIFRNVISEIKPKETTLKKLGDILVETSVNICGFDRSVAKDFVEKSIKEYLSHYKDKKSDVSIAPYRDPVLHNFLKRNLLEAARKKPLPELSKKYVNPDDKEYHDLMDRFSYLEKKAIMTERFDDRLEKRRAILPGTEFLVLGIEIPEFEFSAVTSPAQVSTLVLNINRISESVYPYLTITNSSDKFRINHHQWRRIESFTHEPLHSFDMRRCLAGSNGVLQIGNGIEVCGSDVVYDESVTKNLFTAYAADMARLKVMNDPYLTKDVTAFESASREGHYYKHVSREIVSMGYEINIYPHYISRIESAIRSRNDVPEILPMFTDHLSPISFLIFAPNIAVVRTSTILQNTPEAQFYAAMLRCDKEKVDSMIKEDPSIMDKKYDGISLHHVAKILKEAKYDKFVTRGIKVNKAISFDEISDLVSQKHSEYKKSFVNRVSDKGSQTEHSHNDL